MFIPNVCIVHDRKCLSKFHQIVNQVRQSNDFSIFVLQKLSKRCCSCNGQKGESFLSYDYFHELCDQIQLSMEESSPIKSSSEKSFDYLTLSFPPTLNYLYRDYKTGLFIGKNGKNIRSTEKKFDVQLNVFNRKSGEEISRRVKKLQEENETKSRTDLWILITLKNQENKRSSIEKVKEEIENQWKEAQIRPRVVLLKEVVGSIPLSKDDRWKPKKEKKKYQKKRNEKEFLSQRQQIEVPPQPSVRPISMPKELSKSPKH